MFSNWLFLLLTLVFAFGLNLLLTPVILKIARQKLWLAPINHRSVHREPIPRLGGVGIVLSFAIVVGLQVAVDAFSAGQLPPVSHSQVVVLLALGLAATHVVGLLDDFVEFRAVYKGALQLVGALLAIGSGVVVTQLSIPFTDWTFSLGPFGPLLTLMWIIGVTNAVNLIDGMDGLAGGYSVIALVMIGIWGAVTGHLFQALACAAAVGSLFAFLVFNLPPAKIFMGDSGSLSLGYLIAILSVWGGEFSLFHQFWLLPFTAVLVPVGDTLSAIFRRLRANRPVWAPDREHTHHKLMALGFSQWQILAMIWGLVVVSSSPVLLASVAPKADDLALSCLLSIALVVAAFTVLHIYYRRRFPLQTSPNQPQREL